MTGGFDLGFERAGMVCKWQVEIDDYATRVLEKHWPNVHRERDIRECGRHNLQPVDVICGGFPCQDISYAGLGAGLDGERSGLFFEAVRCVREIQPRFVVLENVAALISGRTEYRLLPDRCVCGWPDRWRRLYLAEQAQQQIWMHLCGAAGGWHGHQGDGHFAVACEDVWRNDPENQKRLRSLDGGSHLGSLWEEGGSCFAATTPAAEAQKAAGEISVIRPAFGERWMDATESRAWCQTLGVHARVEPERARAAIRKLLDCPACGRNMAVDAAVAIQRRWMGTVLGALAAIGFDAEWHCIPAAAVGAPHIRDRVFLHAYSQSESGVPVHDEASRNQGSAMAKSAGEGRDTTWCTGETIHRPGALERFAGCSGTRGQHWATEPSVGRVANGVPSRVDRLRGLGNAVVPQVAEFIGRQLMEAVQ